MNPARILIVEDEAILAAHLALSLGQMGYQPAGQAATGEAAVELALKEKPDAILMDVRLRGEMTGIQAAEAIHRSSDIPIIYLTAYAEESVLQQAKITEAYAVLAKPVRERELRASLEMALYKHEAESQLRRLNQVLRAVRDVNHLITHEQDSQTLLQETCNILAQTRGYTLVWIGKPEPADGLVHPVAQAGEQGDYLEAIRIAWDESPWGMGPTGIAVRERKLDVCRDFAADPRQAPWREAAMRHGFASSAAIPILRGDVLFGVLNVYADKVDFFSGEELDLLMELAGDLAYALEAADGAAARRQAEDHLAQSEKNLQSILENFQDAYFRTDTSGRFVLLSPSAPRQYSYASVEEMMGQPADTLYGDTADRDTVLEEIRRDGRVRDRVGRGRKKDGSLFWVSLNAQCYYDDKGRIAGTEGAARDITEREMAKEALQESESKFRNVFQHSRDAIVVNRDGLHVFENQAYLSLYGYASAEELEGRPVLDLVAPSHRGQIAEFVRLRSAGRPAQGFFESRGLRKDGSEFDTEIQASTFELQGRIHTLAVIRDVSERKKAEARLLKSDRELREAFQSSIRALSSAIEMRDPYTAGHQERVTRLSAAIAREMGLDDDKVEGIRIAGMVHDIGKLSIPAEILSKPTKLSPAEYGLIQSHPQSGYTILETIPFPWPIAPIVLQHHERMDGSGYPNKLAGEAILIEARIIAVADVVEAMSSHRPYRPALGSTEALDEIKRKKGVWFDAAVVDACVRVMTERGFTFA